MLLLVQRVWTFLCVVCLLGLCHGVTAQCKASGRFPNDIVDDCRGYTTCISTVGNFYQYDLTCPPNSIFNHFDKQCANVSGYRCYPDYNCTEEGVFVNPQSNNCSSFVVCIESLTKISARQVDCPEDTVFDQTVKYCVHNGIYTCPMSTDKTMEFDFTTDYPMEFDFTTDYPMEFDFTTKMYDTTSVPEDEYTPRTYGVKMNSAAAFLSSSAQYTVIFIMFCLL